MKFPKDIKIVSMVFEVVLSEFQVWRKIKSKGVTGKLKWYFKEVYKKFQGSVKSVSRKCSQEFPGCFKEN